MPLEMCFAKIVFFKFTVHVVGYRMSHHFSASLGKFLIGHSVDHMFEYSSTLSFPEAEHSNVKRIVIYPSTKSTKCLETLPLSLGGLHVCVKTEGRFFSRGL